MDKTQQIQEIDKGLDVAISFGLETEVVFAALEAMKANPELTPVEAFYLGVNEWVK